jgi:ELWxxDGT repeat protein
VGQFAVFQIDKEEAFQDEIVEDEVDVEIFAVEVNVALSRDEGEELWRSDGTATGTVMVRDIVPIPFEKLSYETIAPTADALYLAAGNDTQGIELWHYFPGAPRPVPVKDIATWDSVTRQVP